MQDGMGKNGEAHRPVCLPSGGDPGGAGEVTERERLE